MSSHKPSTKLCQDLNGQKFCILLDETTDIACKKLLCLIVRYYSKSKKCIVTAFLGLIDVINTTGKDLFAALKEYLQNLNLKLEDCIGYECNGQLAWLIKITPNGQG